jgi:hypothetical protein
MLTVLRIRDVFLGSGSDFSHPVSEFFAIPDPNFLHHGSEFFLSRIGSSIPDPNFFHPGSASRKLRIFNYFNPKKWFLSSEKYDPGSSFRIWIPDPNPELLSISDPRSWGQKGIGSRIPDLDPRQWM